jgi:hypothetical protein
MGSLRAMAMALSCSADDVLRIVFDVVRGCASVLKLAGLLAIKEVDDGSWTVEELTGVGAPSGRESEAVAASIDVPVSSVRAALNARGDFLVAKALPMAGPDQELISVLEAIDDVLHDGT